MINLDPNEYNRYYLALQFILKWEGGYVNDPDDPGGETKWGIAKAYHQDLDIENLTPQQATEIYYEEYWVPSGCSYIPYPLCVVVFDTAVNMGVSQALAYLKKSPDALSYIEARREGYIDRVRKSPVKQKYIKGWLNRLADLQKYIEIEKL